MSATARLCATHAALAPPKANGGRPMRSPCWKLAGKPTFAVAVGALLDDALR